jgi:hypothetical protein
VAAFVAAADTTTGAAARSWDAFKRAHCARRGLGGESELVCVSAEFGRLRAPAYALLCRVSDVAADGGGVSKAAFFKSVLQEMVAQASGRVFLGGCQCRWLRQSGLKKVGRRLFVHRNPDKHCLRVELFRGISSFWAEDHLHIQGDRLDKYPSQYRPIHFSVVVHTSGPWYRVFCAC